MSRIVTLYGAPPILPYAICSTDGCKYLFHFNRNESNQPSRLPPHLCPKCKGRVIFYCPACRWPILALPNPRHPRCVKCTASLRGKEGLPPYCRDIAPSSQSSLDAKNDGVTFSRRELDVIRLLAIGHSSKEVASVLGISLKTVETHGYRIMLKINTHLIDVQAHYSVESWNS